MTSTPNYDSVYRQVQRRLLHSMSSTYNRDDVCLFLLSYWRGAAPHELKVAAFNDAVDFNGVIGRTEFLTTPVNNERLKTNTYYFLEQTDSITQKLMSLPLVGVDNKLGARGATEQHT